MTVDAGPDAGRRDAGARPLEPDAGADAGPADAGDLCAEADLSRTSDVGCTFWAARAPNLLPPAFAAPGAGGPKPDDVDSEAWEPTGSYGLFVLPEQQSATVTVWGFQEGWPMPRRLWHGPVDVATGRAIFPPARAAGALTTAALLIRSSAPVAVWQFNPLVPARPVEPMVTCVPGRPSLPCPSGSVCGTFEGVGRCLWPAASTDSSQLMPARLLGTRHLVGTPEGVVRWSSETTAAFGSQLTIVASEPDTEVSLTPRARLEPFTSRTGGFGGADAGTALSFTLSRFDVLNLESQPAPTPPFFECTTGLEGATQFCRNGSDLTGTVVTSTKPIAVFSGSPCTVLPHFLGFCDFVEEQASPPALWGQEHVLIPAPVHPDAGAARPLHRYKVIAECPSCFGGTLVTVSDPALVRPVGRARCSSSDLLQATCRLEAGEFFEFDLLGPVEVVSSAPVQVLHLVGGAEQALTTLGDPAMTWVLPERQWPRSPVRVPAPRALDHLALQLLWESPLVEAFVDGEPVQAQRAFDRFQYATVTIDAGVHMVSTQPPGRPIFVELYGAGPWGAFLTTGRRRFVELDGWP